MSPEGVAHITARTVVEGAASQATYESMASGAISAAKLLATALPDLVVFACTSGSIVCNRDKINQEISDICAAPATSTTDAVISALSELGAKKLALATPYTSFVVDKEIQFLNETGFEVVSERSLGLGQNMQERLQFQRTSPNEIYDLAISADSSDADAIFISCTGLASLSAIEKIESTTRKPVITSNQATFWHCLRHLDIDDKLVGFGQLLRQH